MPLFLILFFQTASFERFSEVDGNFPFILPLLGRILLGPDRIVDDIAMLILLLHRLFLLLIAHKTHPQSFQIDQTDNYAKLPIPKEGMKTIFPPWAGYFHFDSLLFP
jgi:hypothetical protein